MDGERGERHGREGLEDECLDWWALRSVKGHVADATDRGLARVGRQFGDVRQ